MSDEGKPARPAPYPGIAIVQDRQKVKNSFQPDSGNRGLDSSARDKMGKGSSDQGEIRIKYTDSAKFLPTETPQLLFKDPGQGKSEAVEIKVNFSMAYGETQNFSQPIYSGIFAFKCTFSKKQSVSAILTIYELHAYKAECE